MGLAIAATAIVTSAEEDFSDVLTNTNFPGIILLGIGAIPCLFLLFRWLFKFNREFTDFYIQENQKLRERVDECEKEIGSKDQDNLKLNQEIGSLRLQVERLEHTISYLRSRIEETP